MEYLLAIDAGTTSFKGAVYTKDGALVASASSAYQLITKANGIVEFTVAGYVLAMKSVINELLESSGIKASDIAGLSIDSQGETFVLIDRAGEPLVNAVVWLDSRAIREAGEISVHFGVETVYKHTGQPEIAPTWPACKLLWLKKNNPGIFKKAYKVLLLEDYLIYILTGKFAAERSLLTSTIYYDINTGTWWDDMLDYIGLDRGLLPDIYNSGEPVSKISSKASSEFGLSQGTVVVTGALDQLSGMIGSGAVSMDTVCETTGTCMAVCVNVPSVPDFNPDYQIPCHAGITHGQYYQIFWSQTAGAVLEWFKNNFYKSSPGNNIFDMMTKEAGEIPAGSDGLIMLPHLSGKACPEFNAGARGVFRGITLRHGRAHFTRAIMESVAYMLREHIDTAVSEGIHFDEIRSLGGGANSALWNQMKADVTGKRIVTMKDSEATSLGTAILAGTGTGLFEDIDSAVSKFIRTGMVYEPDDSNKAAYDRGYDGYAELYEKLKDTFSAGL